MEKISDAEWTEKMKMVRSSAASDLEHCIVELSQQANACLDRIKEKSNSKSVLITRQNDPKPDNTKGAALSPPPKGRSFRAEKRMTQAATETIQVIKKLTTAYRRTKDEDLLDMVESLLDVLDILLQEVTEQTFAPYPVQPGVPFIPTEIVVYGVPITTTGSTVSSDNIIATNHTDQDKP